MTDVRALAAQGLAEVALDDASLSRVAAKLQPRLQDARDRALLTALLNEGARWWLRFDPALQSMLSRPLPKREAAVRALLVLGLVQLEVMALPASCGGGGHGRRGACTGRSRAWPDCAMPCCGAGSGNAERLAALDAAEPTRHACPAWLIGAFARTGRSKPTTY